MTEPTDAPAEPQPPAERTEAQAAKAERAARLAKALRDNLRRRKAAVPRRDKPGN